MLDVTGACARVLLLAVLASAALIGGTWLITGVSVWLLVAIALAWLLLASVLRGIGREWRAAARWRWWWFK